MAKSYKRRDSSKKGPSHKAKKYRNKRTRSFAEKFLIVMGVLIVLSMVLSLIIIQGSQAGF